VSAAEGLLMAPRARHCPTGRLIFERQRGGISTTLKPVACRAIHCISMLIVIESFSGIA
jgi:hypothetical protein